MSVISIISHILLIIGGLNWGLIGLADINVVDMLFGGTGIERVIYILVGIAAVWQCCSFKKCCNVDSNRTPH